MTRGLSLIAILLALASFYALGAPERPIILTSADCWIPRDLGVEYQKAVAMRALHTALGLRRDSRQVYGFSNRASSRWYGIRAQAQEIANHFFGLGIPAPIWTEQLSRRAGARLDEHILQFDVALVLNTPVCEVQHLLPRTETDSLAAATERLDHLLAQLYALQLSKPKYSTSHYSPDAPSTVFLPGDRRN